MTKLQRTAELAMLLVKSKRIKWAVKRSAGNGTCEVNAFVGTERVSSWNGRTACTYVATPNQLTIDADGPDSTYICGDDAAVVFSGLLEKHGLQRSNGMQHLVDNAIDRLR